MLKETDVNVVPEVGTGSHSALSHLRCASISLVRSRDIQNNNL
jgi:hypothetical protein